MNQTKIDHSVYYEALDRILACTHPSQMSRMFAGDILAELFKHAPSISRLKLADQYNVIYDWSKERGFTIRRPAV